VKAIARVMLLAGLGVTACSSSPPVSFYTLDGGPLPSAARGNTPSVLISQVQVSELLDRPQLVSRVGNQVRLSEQHRWADPLRRSIPRVFADELGRALDSVNVRTAMSALGSDNVDFRVQLDVQRLEAVGDTVVSVDVLWRIENRQGAVSHGRTTLEQPFEGNGPAAQIAAQRRALVRVAEDVAATIRQTGVTAVKP
jgi:uncharacterized lipoprotein YmbA